MSTELVERLRDESERLSGHSIDRGSVDAGIASNLAAEAADELTALTEALSEAQHQLSFVSRWAWRHNNLLSAEERLSAIRHYPPILAIHREGML